MYTTECSKFNLLYIFHAITMWAYKSRLKLGKHLDLDSFINYAYFNLYNKLTTLIYDRKSEVLTQLLFEKALADSENETDILATSL